MNTPTRRVQPAPGEMDWKDKAACLGATKLFFPRPHEYSTARDLREARAREICGVCAVSGACQEWAYTHAEYGFWAGENEDQRRRRGASIIY